jgi:hypothetical protein
MMVICALPLRALAAVAVAFQESTNDCAVTGLPSWKVHPSWSVIVHVFWSSEAHSSATPGSSSPVPASMVVSGVHTA